MRRSVIALALLLHAAAPGALSARVAVAAPDTAEAAIALFVDLNNRAALQSEQGKRLLAGELDSIDSPGGGNLPPADKVLAIGEGKAVARIPAREGSHPDLYLYLERKSGSWTIVAYRTLAVTGIIWEMRRQLREMPSRTNEQEIDLRNAELILADDQALLAWAADHRRLFERARADPASADVAREFKAEGGGRIRVQNGLIVLSIGGILDNEVGFLFPQEGRVPAIDPQDYIWIEPAGAGYYLFRTT